MMSICFCWIFIVGSILCPQSTTFGFALDFQAVKTASILFHERAHPPPLSNTISHPHPSLCNTSKHYYLAKLGRRTQYGLCLAVLDLSLNQLGPVQAKKDVCLGRNAVMQESTLQKGHEQLKTKALDNHVCA